MAELASLATEQDPDLLCRSWLNFAERQELAGHFEVAASAYQAILASQLPNSSRAQARLDALEGKGATGNRVEYLLGQFVSQAADPGMLGGMMLASTVFQGTRLLGLSRLLANPEAGMWTRGFGARLLANSAGFAAELPTFLFSSKAIHQAMGQAQDWSPRALSREGLGLGLNLFLLKSFAALGQHGATMLGAGRASRILLPQGSALAGIYLGHRAEVLAGLRPESDDAITLVDSLAMLLQFHVGGQFSGALLGPKAARYAQELDFLSRLAMPASGSSDTGTSGQGQALQASLAWLGPRGESPEGQAPGWHHDRAKSALLRPVWMTQIGDGESSPYKFLEMRLRAELLEKMEPGEEANDKVRDRFPAMVNEIAYNYLHTPIIDLQRYFQLMHASRLEDIVHDDDRRTTRIEQLAVATKYFRHVLEMNTFRRGVGSLYDHMMQEAFERVLSEGNTGDYEALVRIAGVQRRIEALENFFRERGWDKRYAFLPLDPAQTPAPKVTLLERLRAKLPLPFAGSTEAPPAWLVRLQGLTLSPEAKLIVERYFRSYDSSWATNFRAGEHNYIRWQPHPGSETRETFTLDVALDGLGSYLKSWKKHPGHLLVLEDALKRAARSSVPLLHLDRVFKVLATRDLPPKLTEVAAQSPFDWGQLEGFLNLSADEEGYEKAVAKLNGTIYTGYIYDRVLAEKFARFYHLAGVYVHEQEMKIRLGQFHFRAQELLTQSEEKTMAEWMRVKKQKEGFPPSRAEVASKRAAVTAQSNYTTEDVLHMLASRPTPIAEQAIKAIQSGEVELQLLSKQELRELWRTLPHDEQDREPPTGLFVPANKSPSGKPLIVISKLEPELTRDQKIVRAITLPALVVHEFEHYLHRSELTNVHLSEMRAWLEEYLFMMQNGNLGSWHEMQETTPYGFGVYLRNLVDKDYVEGPRDVPIRRKP